MEEFKIGDVVTIKSGGPKMTIYGFSTDPDTVFVTWMSENSVYNNKFNPVILTKV